VRWEERECAEQRRKVRECTWRTNHEISRRLTHLNGECLPVAAIKSQFAG
jgi:hypothetical protein